MKNLSKNFVWALAILMALSVLYSSVAELLSPQKEISLSEVVERINAGEVAEITVTDAALEITQKNGETVVAQKESEAGLTETLRNFAVAPEKIKEVKISVENRSGFGFLLAIMLPILGPVLLIAFFLWFSARQVQRGSMAAFSFGQSRARLISPEGQKEQITFKDVAGVKEAKEELKEIVDFLKSPKKYLDIGAKIPKGVLLMGPPGSGKTLLAKAVSGEAGVPFFHMSASEFIEMFVGVGSSRVRDLYRVAKKSGKAIVFIDEVDAVGRIRGAGIGGGHDEREQTLNQILVELDGMETSDAVITLAASVTGDTPVLVRQRGVVRLAPIADVIDPYYKDGYAAGEIACPDLEVLGFERRPVKGVRAAAFGNIFFGHAAFKKARSVFRHVVDAVYEIEYLGGRMRATGNHSVFVRSTRGIETKAVADLLPGDILVDLPYTASRTNKRLRETRAFIFDDAWNLQLPVWQPLFAPFEPVRAAYEYALAHTGSISQTLLGKQLGFTQRTIGKWQQEISRPRPLSRNYYQHRDALPETVTVTPGIMRLLGYYTAEGYARKEIDFCFNEKEVDYIEDVKQLMKEVFHLSVDQERHTTSNAVNVIYHCKPVAHFFAHHCGKGTHNKHIPAFLWGAPREYFIAFLRGYLNGDGYQDKQGRWEATSVSKQLILELQWLARMHGIKTYIRSFTAPEGRKIGTQGKPLRATVAWRIGFGKSQNPFEAQEKIRRSIKRAVVKNIKQIPFQGYVYDFCGCENEAFFGGASPVLLHNTNRPDVLDPALLRPGRFDRRVVLDLPDVNDREEILKIHAHNKPLADDVRLRVIAERTPGFSGADLANLVNEAAILAARGEQKQVAQLELINSIEKVLLGPERKSHLLSPQEKKISAYHEAGHALVAASLPHADPVHKVSIVSRGRAAGYTLKLPLEDRHLYSRSHFIDELASALGGYAAEKLVFGDITTGPHDDLKKATDVARGLVTRFGMSDAVGPVALGDREDMVFLGRELTTERNYSEQTAELIDKEIKRLMEDARRTAEEIVTRRRDKLDAIAAVLMEKETIEREAFDLLVTENGEKKA